MTKFRRQRGRASYNDSVPLLDILFNTLLGFVFLFMIAFMLINPPNSKKIDPKAEVMIVLEWNEKSFDDIDLWALLPSDKAVGFRSREHDGVHLERDDLGIINDYVAADKETKYNYLNREVIVLRKAADGRYVVNVHYYRDNEYSYPDLAEEDKSPIKCKVTIIKLNPQYTELYRGEVILEKVGQELTVVQFDINGGTIENFSQDQRPFVISTMSNGAMQ